MTGAEGADACDLRAAILAGERSAAETLEASLAAIEERDGELGAFLSVERDTARARAIELDRRRAADPGAAAGALFGVPVAVKANLCMEGVTTPCGSRMLANYRAPYTATCVRRLLDADAIVVGVTNMDEFAMGSSSEHSAFGPTRNPWDLTRAPGGSSSGSAAAVAAGMVPVALGSDTGGSVRQPAALCGVGGFKPTYGRVSRHGLIAFGSSLDQVGPLARSVRDLERILGVISGHDPLDATSLPLPPIEPERPDRPERLDGLRVGVAAEYVGADLDAEVRTAVEAALEKLEELGAEAVEVRLPHTVHAIPTYYVVATAEASSNLARFDGVGFGARTEGDGSLQGMFAATREGAFGDEVKRRILLGTFVLSEGYHDAWYGRALRVRALLRRDFERAFEKVDVICGPTSPTPAFPLGERAGDPLAMYASDTLTVPTSLAGLPAVSVPCGFASGAADSPLPVGLQIIGPALADARVLRVAAAFESATEHHRPAPTSAGDGR
ncbi:MAG: Asp-tRNA(Asn)/Glu-tRNA(Gln) amidotransferase subunit GatA [Planctomycetota bacterium]|nr:Asp-tRNA(Asn)/Glu-tRNA(Gln) amidotransferase subunit GatA [Planctomycetota bacterium]MDP6761248.1 Asp-tRNA(Asn)/Glu-tRNA(Gln) amidotransferase subunit GatA [Planctomycetota bacterium]MDP6988367.1 Asp-tRNA(Asn)/Glu-tRNA(Gln) amidotransferase subunit GatA [Planctomycetota bacterium]